MYFLTKSSVRPVIICKIIAIILYNITKKFVFLQMQALSGKYDPHRGKSLIAQICVWKYNDLTRQSNNRRLLFCFLISGSMFVAVLQHYIKTIYTENQLLCTEISQPGCLYRDFCSRGTKTPDKIAACKQQQALFLQKGYSYD